MSTFHRFEDLEAWQNARRLAQDIYRVAQPDVFQNDYALIDQIRRAVVSASANIAEGFGRGARKEFIYFLSIATGSAREVQSLLYIALDSHISVPLNSGNCTSKRIKQQIKSAD